MRAAAVLVAALALTAPAFGGDGDWATASYAGGTATLKLHYLMTCGRPGAGPVEIRLPSALHLAQPVGATVNGKARLLLWSPHGASVTLPKPPQVTCMSIAPGVLTIGLRSVRGPDGTYAIRAGIGSHRFTAQLKIR
jgi:hypothetical protein